MSISKEMIVEASIKILNRDGIENLTMRTIAKELGIKAASLYWHVSGKVELYGSIAEYLCSQFQQPDKVDNPEDYLTAFFMAYRAVLLTTRDAVAVFENSIPNTPKRIELIKENAEALMKMGIQEKNLMTVSNLLNNYVLSFAADEVRFKNAPQEAYEGIPNLPVFLNRPITDIDYDEQFLYGLRVLFAGLDALKQKYERNTQ